MPYSKNKILLGIANSDLTSPPHLIADYDRIAVSVQTSSVSAGDTWIDVANADGLSTALTEGNWSLWTTISSASAWPVVTGPRWLRSRRTTIFAGSAASNATMILQGYVL